MRARTTQKYRPKVFTEAAKLIENGEEKFGCFALRTCDCSESEMILFRKLFKNAAKDQILHKDNEGGCFDHIERGPERQAFRVNALKHTAKVAKELNKNEA